MSMSMLPEAGVAEKAAEGGAPLNPLSKGGCCWGGWGGASRKGGWYWCWGPSLLAGIKARASERGGEGTRSNLVLDILNVGNELQNIQIARQARWH